MTDISHMASTSGKAEVILVDIKYPESFTIVKYPVD